MPLNFYQDCLKTISRNDRNMLISCTKKLADALKIKVFEVVPIRRNRLFEWHANLFVFNRRNGVIMMNNLTRYSVVLYGLKADHFKKFNELVLSAIEQTFRSEGFSDEVISNYVRTGAQMIYAKSSDRSILGQLNDVQYHLEWRIEKRAPLDSVYMVEISKELNRIPLGKQMNYYFAIDLLHAELGKLQ